MNAKRKSAHSDLKKLDKIHDTNIDYSDIPPLDKSFFKKEIVTLPHVDAIQKRFLKVKHRKAR